MGAAHADQGTEQVLGVDVGTKLARCRRTLQQFPLPPKSVLALDATTVLSDFAVRYPEVEIRLEALDRAESEALREALRFLVSDNFVSTFESSLPSLAR